MQSALKFLSVLQMHIIIHHCVFVAVHGRIDLNELGYASASTVFHANYITIIAHCFLE